MIDFAAESQRRYIDNMADTIVTAAFIHCMIDLSFQIMAAVGCWEAAEEGQEKTMKKSTALHWARTIPGGKGIV